VPSIIVVAMVMAPESDGSPEVIYEDQQDMASLVLEGQKNRNQIIDGAGFMEVVYGWCLWSVDPVFD
jgi:hypothetical protein